MPKHNPLTPWSQTLRYPVFVSKPKLRLFVLAELNFCLLVLQTNFREALTPMMMMMILLCYLDVYVVKRLRTVAGQGTVSLLIHFMLSIIIITSKKLGTESRHCRGIWRGFISMKEARQRKSQKRGKSLTVYAWLQDTWVYPRVMTRRGCLEAGAWLPGHWQSSIPLCAAIH